MSETITATVPAVEPNPPIEVGAVIPLAVLKQSLTETTIPLEAQKAIVKKLKPKKKTAVKPKAKKVMPEPEFVQTIIDLMYQIRNLDKRTWTNFRNSSNKADQIDRLLQGQPRYEWKQIGNAYYLFPLHNRIDEHVAYVLRHDPRDEYAQAMKEYNAGLKNAKSKKPLTKPEKPKSFKCDYYWCVANKRGAGEKEGHCATLAEARLVVEQQKSHFLV